MSQWVSKRGWENVSMSEQERMGLLIHLRTTDTQHFKQYSGHKTTPTINLKSLIFTLYLTFSQYFYSAIPFSSNTMPLKISIYQTHDLSLISPLLFISTRSVKFNDHCIRNHFTRNSFRLQPGMNVNNLHVQSLQLDNPSCSCKSN